MQPILGLRKLELVGNDMWGVKVAGDYAFVHDTHNGMFVVDISDPAEPSFVAHRQLEYAHRHEMGRW